MKLKSVELLGFKSFYNKTLIEFREGINAIVGPNGCGKSNIIDAIRWVLGEQSSRQLRAEEMREVISKGSDDLQPLGMAEVSLTIEDIPGFGFDQAVIRRRLYNSGESGYSINGLECRLKDITELFMDTGAGSRAYTVIGQGQVEEFITSKPEDKRRLIDDVAGVVKYKSKRKQTENKLQATKDNLTRIQDMTNEVSAQMERLSKQAKDAKDFKGISDRVNRIENEILNYKITNLSKEKLSVEKRKLDLENKILNLSNQRERIQKNLNDNENEYSNVTNLIQRVESGLFNIKSTVQEKSSFKNYAEKEKVNIDEYVEKLNKEILIIANEKNELLSNLSNKEKHQQEIRQSKLALDSDIEQKANLVNSIKESCLNYKGELDTLKIRILEIIDEQSSLNLEVISDDKRLKELSSSKDRSLTERTEIIEELEKIDAESKNLVTNLDKLNEIGSNLNSKLTQLTLSLDSVRKNLDDKSNEIENYNRLKSESLSRTHVLNDIQSNYGWLPEATRDYVLERKGSGVLGVLSDFIEVPEGYEKALEAALADKMNWVVVNEHTEAIKAIETLRETSIGRGTFIPLKELPATPFYNNFGTDINFIKKIVKVQGIDRSVVDQVLSGIIVVSNIKEALDLRKTLGAELSFATLEGDFLDSSGAISGGSSNGGVFERKREIKEIETKCEKLEHMIDTTSKEQNGFKLQLEEIENQISNLKETISTNNIEIVENTKDLSNLKLEKEKLVKRLGGIDLLLKQFTDEIFEIETNQSGFKKNLELLDSEKGELEEKYVEFEKQLDTELRKESLLEKELVELKIQSASNIEKEQSISSEISDMENRSERLDQKISNQRNEIGNLENKKLELTNAANNAETELFEFSNKLTEKEAESVKLKEDLELVSGHISHNKSKLKNYDSDLTQNRELLTNVNISFSNIEIEIQHAHVELNKIKENYHHEIESSDLEEFDPEEKQIELDKLKRKLNRYGSVNLLAPEEYLKLEERHNFLTEQTQDLENAMETLKKAIYKLDKVSISRFKEAFEKINEKFSEIVQHLFEGGEGKLVITDDEDILNTGIDVMVRPKGKKFQSINLLSGGEKALSAIALVLSACFVKPVPYLLLDEIDAPLDDANTVRFSKLMKKLSADSQVVLITHNKTSMQDADTLIGITSDRSVSSRVVSVELQAV